MRLPDGSKRVLGGVSGGTPVADYRRDVLAKIKALVVQVFGRDIHVHGPFLHWWIPPRRVT
ncbi:MAG: hypothetical protein R3D03_08225 [Geminicoccaceae bacterium]